MSSTARALLACTLLLLAGCAARLPPYGVADQPIKGKPPAPDTVFTMADGVRLPVRVWLPPDGQPTTAAVLALHGFNDSRDQWALPAPVFAASGIAFYAPDQRGFGDTAARATWPGVPALVDDADAMVRQMHQRFPDVPLYVMGQSMGGGPGRAAAGRRHHPDRPCRVGPAGAGPGAVKRAFCRQRRCAGLSYHVWQRAGGHPRQR